MTSLAMEVDDLRRQEAEACQHAEDATWMLQDLVARAWQDAEEAARVQKQRDELLQWDAESRQRIVELLDEIGTERELKLRAEERSMALEQRVKLDAEAVARLPGERDEQYQTSERLRLERGTVHRERDQAVRERDEAQQRMSSL